MNSKGVYCLCIRVRDDIGVEIGALGDLDFPEGNYIYVGSALNGFDARLERHLRMSVGIYSAIHWHIDYLLKEPKASIEDVYMLETDCKIECLVADSVTPFGELVRGFGCSDCRCRSHLFRVDKWDFLEGLGLKRRNQESGVEALNERRRGSPP